MTDPGATTELLGKAGEPCRECGAPLAPDQRYCLNCGKRRGESRIEYEGHLPARGAAGANGSDPAPVQTDAAGAVAPVEGKSSQRDYTPLAAVGGIAVLGVMLLIGVLIGKGDGGTAATPAPVVVQPGEAGGGKTASNEGGDAKAEAKQEKSKGKGGAVSGGSTDTGNAPVASDEALQQLQEQSPQEYSENSAKLPDEIATGGAPPPEDNKTPGGGSKGTAIE